MSKEKNFLENDFKLEEVEQLKKELEYLYKQYQSLGKEEFEREERLKKENEELKSENNEFCSYNKKIREENLKLKAELEVYKRACRNLYKEHGVLCKAMPTEEWYLDQARKELEDEKV